MTGSRRARTGKRLPSTAAPVSKGAEDSPAAKKRNTAGPPRGPGDGGRGATGNPAGRFEKSRIEPFDDGWGTLDPAHPGHGDDPPPLATVVTPEKTRSILSRNDSPDIPFDRSINPYKGCEHGCVYCFARPTHSYLGLSPGLDFESRIFSKPEAAALLRRELAKPRYRCEVIALGANTDPYQPVEKRLGITRSILEVLAGHDHPVCIVTKSNMVLRDLDLIAPMAKRRLASVFVSITTLDHTLARRMEPRAPTPRRRIETIAELTRAGVPAGVLASPMIPGLNDAEMERILEEAAGVGAVSAGWILIRLPDELKEVFTSWLEERYPLKASKVLGLIREARGGRLYEAEFGTRQRGRGKYAELLQRRFETACRRLGLDARDTSLDTTLFRRPAPPGSQPSLFP